MKELEITRFIHLYREDPLDRINKTKAEKAEWEEYRAFLENGFLMKTCQFLEHKIAKGEILTEEEIHFWRNEKLTYHLRLPNN